MLGATARGAGAWTLEEAAAPYSGATIKQMTCAKANGTKGRANARTRKAMSYERILTEEIGALLARLGVVDAQQDERYGKDVRGDEPSAELHPSCVRGNDVGGGLARNQWDCLVSWHFGEIEHC